MIKFLAHIALLVSVLAASTAAAEPVKLRLAFWIQDTEKAYTAAIRPFARAVNEAAKGAIEIELFPNGALGRNPLQQAQMVLDGVADIAFVMPSLNPGRFQENEVLELPGLFRDLREGTLVQTRLVLSGQLKSYDEFYPVGMFVAPPFTLHSRPALASLADLRGKKLRASGAIEGATLKALGAVPVGMPLTEVSEAIGRGTLDGTTSQIAGLVDFGISRVASNHYMLRLGAPVLAVLMNKKKFESLPAAGQAAIRKYRGTWIADQFIEGYTSYDAALTMRLRQDPKRRFTEPSQAEIDTAQAAFKKIIDEWSAKSPRNQQLLKAAQAEIAKVRAAHR